MHQNPLIQHFLRTLITGESKLPIYEYDVNRVKARYKHLTPGTAINNRSSNTLEIKEWPLFHATAKSELARSFSPPEAFISSLLFYLRYKSHFDWNSDNLRINDEEITFYKDSSRSYLVGRFAEGIAHLFMLEQGFVFWDHIPSLILRKIDNMHINHSEKTKRAKYLFKKIKKDLKSQPDFIFEDESNQIVLVESKGGSGDNIAVKGNLKKALNQLANWSRAITPSPDKSYAIGTYLQESSNAKESFIAYVDPSGEGKNKKYKVNVTSLDIKLGNYGAWLSGMGFSESGNAIMNRRRRNDNELKSFRLPSVSFNDRQFVFVPLLWRRELGVDRNIICLFNHEYEDIMMARNRIPHSNLVIMGLELVVMEKIAKCLIFPDKGCKQMMEISILKETDNVDCPWFNGSLFPDGTILGEINLNHAGLPKIELKTFLL